MQKKLNYFIPDLCTTHTVTVHCTHAIYNTIKLRINHKLVKTTHTYTYTYVCIYGTNGYLHCRLNYYTDIFSKHEYYYKVKYYNVCM